MIKRFIKQHMYWLVNIYNDIKYRQRRYSFGKENPDKTFYVIGQDDDLGGLWWLVNKVLMHIAYAEDKGYIPVVDYLNNKTQYQKKGLENKNIWESFFEQPLGYGLDDIDRSKNIIINKKAPFPEKKYEMGNFYEDKEWIVYFHNLYEKYIKMSPSMRDFVAERYQDLFPSDGKVLGVLCRGTDYVTKKPKGHPIQPSTKQVIEDAQEIMLNNNCKYLFLATEDSDVLEDFKKVFKTKLFFLDQPRVSKKDMQGGYLSTEKERMGMNDNPIYSGMIYFTATYFLSKCDCFLASRCGGTKGVLIMSSGFEYSKVYNLGLY